MTTTENLTQTTASDIRPGDFLRRVQPLPRSSVFTTPVDAKVLAVAPHPEFPDTRVQISLDPGPHARSHVLNLAPDRVVTVAR